MENKTIGNRISEARKAKQMSQAALAGLLFISPQAVGKWERGESFPDIVTINRLAEIFGVNLNYFSETSDVPVPSQAGESNGANVKPDEPVVSPPVIRQGLLTDFSAGDHTKGDFAGVSAHNSSFNASTLTGTNFSGADLTGSTFKVSNAREANFDKSNLTDCLFSIVELAEATFNQTIFVRTKFDKAVLTGVKFSGITFSEVKLNMIDLRNTLLEHCTFNGVDFIQCDLRGMTLKGLTFNSVRFDRSALNDASFEGATLLNVSFTPKFALTNKFYRSLKTICFDGARMDKLTYAALNNFGAGLSKATII